GVANRQRPGLPAAAGRPLAPRLRGSAAVHPRRLVAGRAGRRGRRLAPAGGGAEHGRFARLTSTFLSPTRQRGIDQNPRWRVGLRGETLAGLGSGTPLPRTNRVGWSGHPAV